MERLQFKKRERKETKKNNQEKLKKIMQNSFILFFCKKMEGIEYKKETRKICNNGILGGWKVKLNTLSVMTWIRFQYLMIARRDYVNYVKIMQIWF